MAKVDDYKQALELAKENLKSKDPARVAGWSGASFEKEGPGKARWTLPFLQWKVSVGWPDFTFSTQPSGDDLPIQQQILLLHYLDGCQGARVEDRWIAYQEVPDGKFYLDAFMRRAKNPMVQAFGSRPELLASLASQIYESRPLDQGDVSVMVRALPLVPVGLVLWREDDEFPPEGNFLFDRSIQHLLSAEDIAWLAGMIVYPLMGMAGGK